MILVLLKVTLLLMIGLAGARVAKRARAATRHALLASALAASLLVPIPALTGLRINFAVPVPGRLAVLSTPAPVGDSTLQDELPESGRHGNTYVRDAAATGAFWTIERALLGLWALGVVVVGAVPLHDLWMLRRLRRDGLPWIAASDLVRDPAVGAGLRRAVTLVTHEDVRTPLTMGWFRPTLLMPAGSTAWDEAALRRALIHEIEHVRRHDWPVQLMARVACATFWFHPIAWAAFRRLALEAERACDDAVLAVSDQTDYATQLVDLARGSTGRQPAAGLTMAARGDLAARVRAILDPAQRRGRAGAGTCGAAAAAAVLLAAAIAPLHAVAEPDAPATAFTLMGDRVDPNDVEQARRVAGRPGRGAAGLMRTAQGGDIDSMRTLIAGGADVNAAVPGDGSPLIAAARGGSLEAVRLLLDAGADPGMGVLGDGSPLIAAAAGGSTPIVAELLDRGAPINDVVPGDENPLIAASAAGHLQVVRLLVSRGADVNASAWSGTLFSGGRGEWRTPLERARRRGHDQVAQFLTAVGAKR